MAGAKPQTPHTYTYLFFFLLITWYCGLRTYICRTLIQRAYSLSLHACLFNLLDRPHPHGVPGHDLAVHPRSTKHPTCTTRPISHSPSSTSRNAPPSSNFPRTTSLCGNSSPTWPPDEQCSTSTTTDVGKLNKPTLDERSYGSNDSTIPSSTTDYTPTGLRPSCSDSSSTDLDTTITAFIFVTTRAYFCTTWLRRTPYWHPTCGTMETGRRISWHQQGEWFGFSIQDSSKPLLELQGHRRNGSFAGASMEILVPRHPQHMVETHSIRSGNLRHSFWQHRYDCIIAELVAQLRSRNVDLDKLATYKSRSAGHCVNQKEATQNMAKEIAQLLQSWLPSHPPADQASQQRILELEAELAKMKSDAANPPPNTSTPAHPASSPIGRAFQGQAAASTTFDPAALLVSPGSVDPWLVANQPDSLTETQYKRWLKDLKLPQHQQDTLAKQLEKVKEWWQHQPDEAVKTVQRASVAMGIDPGKHKNATSDEIVLRVMTVAMLMHSWLAGYLNSRDSKVKPILADLAVAHACILTLAFVTPSCLSPSIDVFYGLRMIQSALMGQYVLLHPKANSKLQALLRGTPLGRIFFCSSWEELSEALVCFKHHEAVYLLFSHIANFQPKFYIGSTSSFVLDREHSRYRKFLQVQQNKFVLAEVALRFWCRFDNFWMWSVFPVYTNKPNFWALEQALIQLWQPRLNTPFMYQFFNCRKGIIQRTKFSGSRQFGTFSLWRKLRWKSTPTHVRRALQHPIFGRRVKLWEVIQDLGTNSVKRFHMEKRIRSNEFGQQGCYFLRRLANNLGEPQRSYAINAIDRALTFWRAKRVRRPVPLRAPWLVAPDWTKQLRRLLTTHTPQPPRTTTPHCKFLPLALYSPNTPQSWTVYAITRRWLHNGLQETNHNVLALHFADLPRPLYQTTNTSSWTGTNYSLTTAHSPPFPRDHFRTKSSHLQKKSTRHYSQHSRRGLPAILYLPYLETQSKQCGYRPYANTIVHFKITSLTKTLLASNNNSLKRSFTMKTNELPHYVCIAQLFTTDAFQQPSPTPWSSGSWRTAPSSSLHTPSPTSKNNLANSTLGHWEPAKTYRMPTFSPSGKSSSWLEGPLWASLQLLFDPCWTASPRWYTISFPKLFHTTWRRATFSTSSSASRTPTSTTCLRRRSTTRTWPDSSPVSTPTASSIAGAWHSSSSLRLWVQILMKSSRSKQTPPTTPATWSKVEPAARWTSHERSSSVTSNASSWCPWKWHSSLSAIQFMPKFEAPPWALHWARPCVWWSWHCQKRSGTKPTTALWPPWTCPLDSSDTWTTDYALRTRRGTMTYALPTSYTLSSTANRSSLRPSLTRNSWVFALNSNHLHYDTAHLVISIRSWLLFPPLRSTSNCLGSYPDCFWWPNAPTLNPNKPEVLPHCTDCTERLASLKVTLLLYRNQFANFYMLKLSGKKAPRRNPADWNHWLSISKCPIFNSPFTYSM